MAFNKTSRKKRGIIQLEFKIKKAGDFPQKQQQIISNIKLKITSKIKKRKLSSEVVVDNIDYNTENCFKNIHYYINEEAISYLKTTYALILTKTSQNNVKYRKKMRITFKLQNKMDQKLTNTSKTHKYFKNSL